MLHGRHIYIKGAHKFDIRIEGVALSFFFLLKLCRANLFFIFNQPSFFLNFDRAVFYAPSLSPSSFFPALNVY